tara:strand:+ start:824 stop:997 length:174 start_codon:yes stop_codon:yes gene_type:complete
MSHKIYEIEILEGDMVYVGKDIKAKNKDQAIKIMTIMSGGLITDESEVIHCEVKQVH